MYKVPFGDLKIGPSTKKRIEHALEISWISEGRYVREFEEKFAAKFGWKYAIATSSGTDAGIVVWSAIREMVDALNGHHDTRFVITPACAFAATANCLLAAGLKPWFVDVEDSSMNLPVENLSSSIGLGCCISGLIGVQFVANIGKPSPIDQIHNTVAKFGKGGTKDYTLVADWCEAHGATINGEYADHYADASIYSFYTAHLIVGGEGGIICTNDKELATLCRSVKSHGRPVGSTYFSFDRVGYNSKWNDLCAAVALEGLERFDETFAKRREVRRLLMDAITLIDDKKQLQLYPDGPNEVIAPHAFPLRLRPPFNQLDLDRLYVRLENAGIQCKTLFGSLPTQHDAHRQEITGSFPVAERIGEDGLHFGCNEFMGEPEVELIAGVIKKFLQDSD